MRRLAPNNKHNRQSLMKIPLSLVQDAPFLPKRTDMGDIVELAKALRESGDVDVPIKVRPRNSYYELIWGYRRVAAAMLAGLKEVSALVQDIDDKELIKQHIMENMFRKDKNPIEEAELFEACKRVMNKTYDEIARMLGIRREYIYNRVELLKLSQPVLELLKNVSSATNTGVLYMGRLLLKVDDPSLQYRLAREAVRSNLSVRELQRLIDDSLCNWGQKNNKQQSKQVKIINLTQYAAEKDTSNKWCYIEVVGNNDDNKIKQRKLTIVTHAVTHIDTPKLFYNNGRGIEDYGPERFQVNAFVAEVTKTSSQVITTSDIPRNVDWDHIQCLLLNTGFSKFYGTNVYYEQHPYLSNELCSLLIQKGIKMIGIDVASVDAPHSLRKEIFDYPVHRELLKNDILIIENVADMSLVNNSYVSLGVIPFLSVNIDEVPVVLIAIKLKSKKMVRPLLQKS